MIPFPAASITGRRAAPLDLTRGSLSRSTEASYLTKAANDGTTAFMSWAGVDTLRLEDRGDGNGPMVLLEGASGNYLQYAEDFVAPWAGAGTRTADAVNGPDGNQVADRLAMASGNLGWYQFYTSYTGPVSHSSWVRAVSGTAFARRGNVTYGLAPLSGCVAEATVGTTWQRLAFSYGETSGGTYAIVADARDWSSVGGAGATASDCYWDLTQVERLAFPTSAMRNASTLFTRAADILTVPMTSVPSFMVNGRWTFDVCPIFSSAQGVTHGADQTLFAFATGTGERIFLVVSGGSIYLRVTSGGSTKVTSNAITFSAHQKLSVIVDGVAGSIAVSGATTGNGTVTGSAWTRSVGSTLYVGASSGGSTPAYVRLGRYCTRAA